MKLHVLAALALTVASQLPSPHAWGRANTDVRRLEPSAFPQLPAQVARYLHDRGCTIPQPYAADVPRNVVAGDFISGHHRDWAVLCSVDRVSTILVFRGGGISHVDELARRDDADYLQVVDDKRHIGYSRAIGVATPTEIRQHGRNANMTRLDHEGIDDSFVEKASVILYLYRGRWLKLQGFN